MNSVGIDIGKRQHVAAVCRLDQLEAEKRVLRFGADRAGLAELSAWMERQGEVSRVVMERAFWAVFFVWLIALAVRVARSPRVDPSP